MPPESSRGVSGRVWIPETAAAGDLEPVGLALLARLHALLHGCTSRCSVASAVHAVVQRRSFRSSLSNPGELPRVHWLVLSHPRASAVAQCSGSVVCVAGSCPIAEHAGSCLAEAPLGEWRALMLSVRMLMSSRSHPPRLSNFAPINLTISLSASILSLLSVRVIRYTSWCSQACRCLALLHEQAAKRSWGSTVTCSCSVRSGARTAATCRPSAIAAWTLASRSSAVSVLYGCARHMLAATVLWATSIVCVEQWLGQWLPLSQVRCLLLPQLLGHWLGCLRLLAPATTPRAVARVLDLLAPATTPAPPRHHLRLKPRIVRR